MSESNTYREHIETETGIVRKLTSGVSMRFPIITPAAVPNPCAFVAFWQQQFDYPTEKYHHIEIRPLTPIAVEELYTWKNGMNLSTKKDERVKWIVSRIDIINQLELHFDEVLFTDTFGNLRPVWQIFLRHIIKPERWPIFDQHVYRAWRYMVGMAANDEKKGKGMLSAYQKGYVPFFNELSATCPSTQRKDIDASLWAFGKFLNLYPNLIHEQPAV